MAKESTESNYRKSYEQKLMRFIQEDEEIILDIMLKRIEFAEGLDNLIQSKVKRFIDDYISPESVAKHILKDGLEERLEHRLSWNISKMAAYEVYKKIRENSPKAKEKRYYRGINRTLEKEIIE